MYKYLSEANGLNFIISRFKNEQVMNPSSPSKAPSTDLLSGSNAKASTTEQTSSEEEDVGKDVVRFIGDRLGMKLSKSTPTEPKFNEEQAKKMALLTGVPMVEESSAIVAEKNFASKLAVTSASGFDRIET